MTQSKQIGKRKHMKKTPKRKTSVYLDEENIETIKGFKDKYNLSLNRTINMCLTKYLARDASLDLICQKIGKFMKT